VGHEEHEGTKHTKNTYIGFVFFAASWTSGASRRRVHCRRSTRSLLTLALVSLLVGIASAQLRVAPVGERPGAISLELMLRKLGSTGTFMQTDAHPDDEDNALLAMLSHGQGMRAVLVAATRGNGGQNEIGPELFEPLGVLRTEELLAVHRFDGAEQYFTRAIDFGYSFSVEESIEKWGHDEIVGDFVRHIRAIRPDVIAAFLCGGEGGGQHHQASAQLTTEAFRAAADPAKYPEQIKEGLRPWQAMRVYCTDPSGFGPPGQQPLAPGLWRTDVAGFDPVLGRTYAALGLEARSMHKCQGTSQLLLLPGQAPSRVYRLRGSMIEPSGTSDGRPGPAPFNGIDTSLAGLARFVARPPAGLTSALGAIAKDVAAARQALQTRGGAATVAPLAAGLEAVRGLRAHLSDIPETLAPIDAQGSALPWRFNHDERYEVDFRLAQKETQFQQALAIADGIRVEALADDGAVTPGQTVNVSIYAAAAGGDAPSLTSVELTGFDAAQTAACKGTLTAPAAVTCRTPAIVPRTTHFSTPYWRPRKDSARYDFDPDVPFGVPFRPSPFHAVFHLTIGGADVTVDRVVEFRYSDVMAGEKRMEIEVVPAFNVRTAPEIAVIPSSSSSSLTAKRREIRVTVQSNQKGVAAGTVALRAPAGWRVEPASVPVTLSREDDEASVKFTIAPAPGARVGPGEVSVTATMTASGVGSDLGYDIIEYPHIHRRLYVHPAATRVKAIDVKIAPGLRVGYIMGVGDQVPQAIEQLGAAVESIDADTLASGDLSKYDAIVTGVRAYERRADLRANNRRLIEYAEKGGTVLVQYNKFEFNAAQYGPYPAKVSDNRVTDENAPVEVLVPSDPVFTTPNRLGADAWAGWVQERGLYFLGEKDPRYVDLVRLQDPFPYNPAPKTGALVEARVGRGRWVYIGLGLWRQLPAGTDGAYRLMANLLSLGRK